MFVSEVLLYGLRCPRDASLANGALKRKRVRKLLGFSGTETVSHLEKLEDEISGSDLSWISKRERRCQKVACSFCTFGSRRDSKHMYIAEHLVALT